MEQQQQDVLRALETLAEQRMDGNAIFRDKAGQICTMVCLNCKCPYYCIHHVSSSNICADVCKVYHLCFVENTQTRPACTIPGVDIHSVQVHLHGHGAKPFCLVPGVHLPSRRQETVVTYGTYIITNISQVQREHTIISAQAASAESGDIRAYRCPTVEIAALLGISTQYSATSIVREMLEQLPFCITADATDARLYNMEPLRMNTTSVQQSTYVPPLASRRRRRKKVPKKIVAATVSESVETTTASDAGPSALPYIDNVD